MNNTIFKIAENVYDDIVFPGKVGIVKYYRLEADNSYKVVVDWGDLEAGYDLNGKFGGVGVPTLSKVPYTFQLPDQPHEFKEGDPVLVKGMSSSTWHADRFVRYYDSKFTTVKGVWVHCIPFDIEKLGRV